MIQEIWKDIEGWEGLYQVSNLGDVKSLPKIKIRSNGKPQTFKERILRPGLSNGYLSISIYDRQGNKKTHTIHRLVATHFIPNPDNLPEVNHVGKDENGMITKLDNRSISLEWASTRENSIHGFLSKNKKSSRYAGVYKTIYGTWVAHILLNSHRKSLGSFKTELEAKEAYQSELRINNIKNKYAL
jgi:hypothetical protein